MFIPSLVSLLFYTSLTFSSTFAGPLHSKRCHALSADISILESQIEPASVNTFCSSWLADHPIGSSEITGLKKVQVSAACSCINGLLAIKHTTSHTGEHTKHVAHPKTTPFTSPTTSSSASTSPAKLTLPTNSIVLPSGSPNPATDPPIPSDTSNAFLNKTTVVGNQSGTESSFDGPFSLGKPAPVILTPALPPGIDMGGLGVLTPDSTSPLVYGGPNSTSNLTTTIAVTMTYEYPSIVLDHSIYITSVQCSGTSISGYLDHSTASAYCMANWPAASAVLLISTACGIDGQYGFFLASNGVSIDSSKNTFSAFGSLQNITEITKAMAVGFGVQPNITTPTPRPFNTSVTLGCSAPNTNFTNNLPAFPCGPDFDEQLDNYLGYYSSVDLQQTIQAFAPTPAQASASQRLVRRDCGWFSWLCDAVDFIVQVVTEVIQVVADVVCDVVEAVVPSIAPQITAAIQDVAHAAEEVVQSAAALTKFVVSGDYTRTFSLSIDLAPPSELLLNSPWGEPGFKFYSWTADEGGKGWELEENAIEKLEEVTVGDPNPEPGVDLWCVNCGVQGQLSATGGFSVSITEGFSSGYVALQGNLYAGLFIGLDAFAEWDESVTHNFFTVGLPGFSIPDIVTIGPSVSFGVSADLDITDEGQYLLGGSLNWPNVDVYIDILDSSGSSASGLIPQVTDTFSADGTIQVQATLGLPVTLGFGINVLAGKWDAEVKMINTPGIRATAEFDNDISFTNGKVSTDPSDGCYGISWEIGFVNELDLDLSDFGGPSFNLFEWDSPPIADGCIGEPDLQPTGSSAQPTASSTAASPPSATAPSPSFPHPPTAVVSSTPTATDLQYFACAYAGVDQTELCNDLWRVGDSLYIQTDNMTEQGFIDNIPSETDVISFMFRYGSDNANWMIGIIPENQGSVDIAPYNWDTFPDVTPGNQLKILQYDYDASTFLRQGFPGIDMLASVWGYNYVEGNEERMYDFYTKEFPDFPWEDDVFGDPNWSGGVSGAVFYRTMAGDIHVLAGAEYQEGEFPQSAYPGGFDEYKKRDDRLVVGERDVPTEVSTVATGASTFSPAPLAQKVTTNPTSTSIAAGSATSTSTAPSSTSVSHSSTNIWAIGETTFQLNATETGSLSMCIVNATSSDPATIFEYEPSSELFFGATSSRFFYYMPAEMNATGTSRFRVGALGSIPSGANLITMAPFQTGSAASGEVALLAFDTSGNHFWPAMCMLQGQGSKVFLVQDPQAGAGILESPDLTYTIIGGVASNCTVLALTADGLGGYRRTNSTTQAATR